VSTKDAKPLNSSGNRCQSKSNILENQITMPSNHSLMI